jgi:hypothetical protein
VIKIPTDRYGNKGWVVKARKAHWCGGLHHRLIEPGEHYYRGVAFPDGDVNTGSAPWVLKMCRECVSQHDPERAAAFEEAVRKSNGSEPTS